MIDKVGTVSVFVEDQERAKTFYTETLGFELRADAPLYPGATERWIGVAPQGAQTEIVLYAPDENWAHYKQTVGKSQALTLSVADLDAVYDDLKAKGVTFVSEPEKQPWGRFATIQDSEGNKLLLVQQPNGA